MAKKRASTNPNMNQPPIGDDSEWKRQQNRRQNLQNSLRANMKPGKTAGEVSPLTNSERKAISMEIKAINAGEKAYVKNQVKYPSRGSTAMDRIMLNAPGPKTTASPAPGRGPKKDTLSGLTHEGGTKSLLKGMLKFFQ